MATTNLGRVKPIHRGVYDPDFLYTPLDIVRYQGASYFCIKASQGNVPQDGEFFMAIVDGDLRYAQTAGGADANFTEAPQIDGQSLDDRYQHQEAGKGLSTSDYTDNEKSKLEGIEVEATKNATDAHLLNRENHTGTQTLATISDAGSAAAASVEEFDAAGSAASAVTAHEALEDPHTQYMRKSLNLSELTSATTARSNLGLGTAATMGTTASRTSSSTSTLLLAAGMNAHRTSGDHDARYALKSGGADANFTTMPQVGGAPIVESGSNSDGSWTRWADGTMVCYRNITFEGSGTAITGTGFYTSPIQRAPQMPVQFFSTPEIQLSARTASGSYCFATCGGGYNPSHWPSECRAINTNGEPNTFHLHLFASGRWK